MTPKAIRLSIRFAVCLAGALFASTAPADVTLPRVLSDHMVLQRGVAVPVWGSAKPNESVTVVFRDQRKTTAADSQGKWIVRLDPLQVGAPASLTITAGNTIILTDVLVGEVWVGSGQSNMDTDVYDYTANDVPLREAAARPHANLRLFRSDVGSGWQTTSPEALRRFSAQLFYFGQLLSSELDVPVGVMEGAVRGSPAANWISADVVQSDPGIQAAIADFEKYHPVAESEKRHKDWQDAIARLPEGTPDNKRPQEPWRAPPAGSTKGPRGDYYDKHIRPMMPFAIRGVLWDQGEGGTNIHGVNMDIVMAALIKSWRKDWGQGNFAFLYVQKPSGGGCALIPDDPINRGADVFVPLPKDPPQRYWDADARLQYVRIMTNPNTFMVTSSDLAPGVHPANKSGYATRGCRVALGAVYAKPVEYYGPIYKSSKVQGSTMRLTFDHVGKGLTVPAGQKLQGFAIAGEDKRFYWADASIDGEMIVLSSPNVPLPVAARYAWSWDIRWANLFNEDGLPAIMFRTDSWW